MMFMPQKRQRPGYTPMDEYNRDDPIEKMIENARQMRRKPFEREPLPMSRPPTTFPDATRVARPRGSTGIGAMLGDLLRKRLAPDADDAIGGHAGMRAGGRPVDWSVASRNLLRGSADSLSGKTVPLRRGDEGDTDERYDSGETPRFARRRVR